MSKVSGDLGIRARIVLIDDHKIIREGLRLLLEGSAGIEVVGEADNGRSGIDLVNALLPDAVIMDVSMPDLNGIEACRKIAEKFPEIKIIALSMHAERKFVEEMLKAGASAYILKDNAFDELSLAISASLKGNVYLSPEITRLVVTDFVSARSGNPGSLSGVFQELTSREREVLQLLAEGISTKQISRSLKVSVKTIETHRQQIMHKLGLHSIAEITKYAIREGITSVEK
jgi:two-component system, NarL family, response regulator NreC